jgi:RNA-binding protein
LDSTTRKQYRKIAHHLQPIIMVGDGGVSEAVVAETNRALLDHELIKVRINVADREDRQAMGESLLEACTAETVQRIGKVLVIYRANPEVKAELSNVTRAGLTQAT